MSDRSPRPEGMSDERLKEIAARVEAATVGPWQLDHDDRAVAPPFDDLNIPPWIVVPDDEAEQMEMPAAFQQIKVNNRFIAASRTDVPDLLLEIARLRADGATLREELASVTNTLREIRAQQKEDFKRADEAHAAHSASFGSLATLSAALFDGEVDDYDALAEKIIARVRQLESDGATLRERARNIDHPGDVRFFTRGSRDENRNRVCAEPDEVVAMLTAYAALIDSILASAPKEPTP